MKIHREVDIFLKYTQLSIYLNQYTEAHHQHSLTYTLNRAWSSSPPQVYYLECYITNYLRTKQLKIIHI